MHKFAITLLLGLVVGLVATAVAVAAEEVKCEGTIAKVDGAEVTVKAEAESHVMTVNDKTKITLDGSAGKATDLKAGQKVKCVCHKEDDKLICVSIEATSA